nr:MAG TPA: hypothetical protein [Caudoviricetes sp.]
MTNKRKHQLERMVRVEYQHFNHIIYPKRLRYRFIRTDYKVIV